MCQVSLPQQEQVLYNFCLCSCINNSCMEEESVGVTYNKLVVSKTGDFIVHMAYFSKTNENRSSENDPFRFILSLVGHGPNPLSMISISNMRHSHASSCISPVNKRPVGLYSSAAYWNHDDQGKGSSSELDMSEYMFGLDWVCLTTTRPSGHISRRINNVWPMLRQWSFSWSFQDVCLAVLYVRKG